MVFKRTPSIPLVNGEEENSINSPPLKKLKKGGWGYLSNS
jgi:hypothetical protein